MKILTLGWMMMALMINAASSYDPEAEEGRIAKKSPSPPIADVIEQIKACMEAHKAVTTRMESQFGWPFDLSIFFPEPKGSFQRTKAATTTTNNDY